MSSIGPFGVVDGPGGGDDRGGGAMAVVVGR